MIPELYQNLPAPVNEQFSAAFPPEDVQPEAIRKLERFIAKEQFSLQDNRMARRWLSITLFPVPNPETPVESKEQMLQYYWCVKQRMQFTIDLLKDAAWQKLFQSLLLPQHRTNTVYEQLGIQDEKCTKFTFDKYDELIEKWSDELPAKGWDLPKFITRIIPGHKKIIEKQPKEMLHKVDRGMQSVIEHARVYFAHFPYEYHFLRMLDAFNELYDDFSKIIEHTLFPELLWYLQSKNELPHAGSIFEYVNDIADCMTGKRE